MFRDGRVIAVFFYAFRRFGPFGKRYQKDEDHFDLFTLQKINMENLKKTALLTPKPPILGFQSASFSFFFRYLDIRNFTPALTTADAPVVEGLGFPSFLSPPKNKWAMEKKAPDCLG